MPTASAGRATRVRRKLPRVPRALVAQRSRGLRVGQGRRQAQGPDNPAPALKREEWI